jgi:hypothetical protein
MPEELVYYNVGSRRLSRDHNIEAQVYLGFVELYCYCEENKKQIVSKDKKQRTMTRRKQESKNAN